MPKKLKGDLVAREFGQRLVQLLAANNVPRHGAGAYLHRKYGVSTVTANAWLNGEHRAETDLARRIAVDHGSTFHQLYFGKPTADEPVITDDADEQRITRLENDIHALNLALSALTAVMVLHRPAEALAAAESVRKLAPSNYQDRGLIGELLEVLEQNNGRQRKAAKRSAS